MARRKKVKEQGGTAGEPFGVQLNMFEQEEAAKERGGTEASEANSLLERISALERANKELNDSLERTRRSNLALMTTPPTPTPTLPSANPPAELSYEGLPDPALDPAGFKKGLEDRNRAYFEGLMRSRSQGGNPPVDLAARAAALWDEFKGTYSGYGDADKDRVDFVSRKVIERMRQRGVDINRYVFTTSEEFFADVHKEFKKVFGQPTAAASRDDSNAGGGGEGDSEAEGDDDDEGRTGGFLGGGGPGSAASRGKGKESAEDSEPHPNEMFRKMLEWQKASGFVH